MTDATQDRVADLFVRVGTESGLVCHLAVPGSPLTLCGRRTIRRRPHRRERLCWHCSDTIGAKP